MLDNSNPATLFPGTTWQKQEGRFLQGTSGSVTVASAGEHRHQVDNHAHTQPSHSHYYEDYSIVSGGGLAGYNSGANSKLVGRNTNSSGGDNTGGSAPNTNATGSHGHSATLSISNTGSGSSFSIIPPYLRVNIWKRLT